MEMFHPTCLIDIHVAEGCDCLNDSLKGCILFVKSFVVLYISASLLKHKTPSRNSWCCSNPLNQWCCNLHHIGDTATSQVFLIARLAPWTLLSGICCRAAYQIPERLEKSKLKFCSFETSRDLAVRRLSAQWLDAQGYFTSKSAMACLLQCQWNNSEGYGKIRPSSQNSTTQQLTNRFHTSYDVK